MEEDDLPFSNPSDAIVKHYLENSKVIVGLSDREETTSNRVSKGDGERGYRIIPNQLKQQAPDFW